MIKRLFKFIFKLTLVLGLVCFVAGVSAGVWYYLKITKDLPKIERLSDYNPKAVTKIVAKDGTLLAEVYEEKRYPVTIDEIPKDIINAILAAEDANFYEHPGIDLISIVRAVWVNLRHKSNKQGASTITQQIVKSLLLTRAKTYERKAKEAVLAYRLEKALTKDEILTMYLNEIYLGSHAYGIKAAAKVHFRKELSELNIAEAAYLAGLPQKPGRLSMKKYRGEAIGRQRYVISQMLRNKYITPAQARAANEYELEIFPHKSKTVFAAPYFTTQVIRSLESVFESLNQDISANDPGGYTIRTTLDINAYNAAEKAVKNGLRAVDKRRGWRGPLGQVEQADVENHLSYIEPILPDDFVENEIHTALVTKVNHAKNTINLNLAGNEIALSLKKAEWAKKYLDLEEEDEDKREKWVKPISLLKSGSLVEVSLKERSNKGLVFQLDQTPEVQGALFTQNTRTGEVAAVIGGYDFKQSKFNRATQGRLQPGSSFKPFIYSAAIDELSYTPSTIVPDSPISLTSGDGTLWSPQNYDRKFIGPITLRTALQRSRNVISVYLLTQMGIQAGIDSAKAFGISTTINRNMSIALGTPEVKLSEMVRGYGVFANKGWMSEQQYIDSIEDRNGKLIYKNKIKQKKVINEDTAFIMSNMMKGVVERGTAQIVKQLKRPVGGKTGTTSEQMDAWFIGFTPEWATGVWVGFDVKKTIGKFETGGKAAAPIFLEFMKEFLKDQPKYDFEVADDTVPVLINLRTGQPTSDLETGFYEYFKTGTEPSVRKAVADKNSDYLASDEF